jgi:hypothetical protein
MKNGPILLKLSGSGLDVSDIYGIECTGDGGYLLTQEECLEMVRTGSRAAGAGIASAPLVKKYHELRAKKLKKLKQMKKDKQ